MIRWIKFDGEYDEFGQTKASVALTGYPYRYTGRRLDPETGLYYYRARYYDPDDGRFLQTDPIGYEDQMNLYAYVGNNPLNATDPSGLVRCTSDVISGSSSCERVHRDAEKARGALLDAQSRVDSLRGALKNGGRLTKEQQETYDAFEAKYGKGSVSQRNLRNLSKTIGKIHDAIGARGEGVKVTATGREFGGYAAIADPGFLGIGRNVTIYNEYFRQLDTRPAILSHEVGHFYGLKDQILPGNAPGNIGLKTPFGDHIAYGESAAVWLAKNQPRMAKVSNNNLQCFVFSGTCGR